MKIRGISYVYIVIIITMLAVVGWSLGVKYFFVKLLPLTIGGIVFILAVIGLVREILAGNKPEVTEADGQTGTKEQTRNEWLGYLVHGGWVVGFFLAIYLLGFMVSMPLFILTYMRWLGTRWRTATAFAVITPVLIYVIFDIAMGIDLYQGLLFDWLFY